MLYIIYIINIKVKTKLNKTFKIFIIKIKNILFIIYYLFIYYLFIYYLFIIYLLFIYYLLFIIYYLL